VLCIGDAVTYGWATDQEDVFPRRLEAILREGYPGAAIEVVNAGVPGWSWLQGLRFLESEGLGLHPDVVVMGLGTNDQMKDTRSTDLENLGGSTAWSHALFHARNLLGNTPLPQRPPARDGRRPIGNKDRIAPVEEFGELYLMSGQAHPDGAGHALIADALAADVEQLPSFRRFVDQIGNAPAR
jgi:lysophospholipase L1-like esterase